MSKEETKVVETVSNPEENKKSRKKWLLLLIPILLLMLLLGYCSKSTVSAGELTRLLKSEGTETIRLNGNVEIKEPLVINGEKTISGSGKIILVNELKGEFPDEGSKSNSWGMGCTKLEIEDTDAMAAFFNVGEGATLTIDGSVDVDAAKKANAIHVAKGGKLIVKGKATIENGRYVNIAVAEEAAAEIKGGNILNAQSYGMINAGTLEISGGKLSGAEKGAVVFNLGTAVQSGGTIEAAGVHNVYVSSGTFTMTGGTNTGASKDGIVVQEGAVAKVEDGDINTCVHGLCNNGEMEVGKITLEESGIMNYKTGVLKIDGTTVDVSSAYCLANNGGKVSAKDFTAKKCDTCAIYNFSGDMELIDVTVTGSRDGNITNGGGNLTVKGGQLDKARDKSIIVGNGKAVFEDVTVAGTSREKYGVYVYGGELYMTNAEVYDVSSTAFKVDTGGYVELKDVDMKDIAEIGFRTDGGKLVAENVSMENLGSHAFYNMNGEITVTDAKVDTIEKNAIQQKGGTTTLTKVEVENIGNHTAYIELGKVVVTDSSFKNMEGNGFYLIEGENEAILKNVTLDGVKKQGVNNQSKITIDGLTVKNATQNGIFNKEKGTITAKNVEINGVGEHGVNNYNQMTLTDAKISNTGKGSNGLQNKGTLTIEKVSVVSSKNHGVYNTGTVKGSDLTIKSTVKNGVYNNKGTFEVTKVAVSGTGEHGINNSASMTVSEVTVKDTGKGKNSVQNAGILNISKATLTASKNHGIYNTGAVSGKNVTIENVAKNGVYITKGTVQIAGLNIKNTGEHSINNEATAIVSNATLESPGEGKNCIQNSGSIEVTKTTLKDSKNHGIYNTGTVTANDLTVKDVAKNGIYNYQGTTKIAGLDVKNTGEHGINNEAAITVSNATIAKSGEGKNSIQNSGTVTVSNTTLKDSKNHGIYNTGTVTANDIKVQDIAKNGIYNNENGSMKINGADIKATGEHGINNAATITVANATITTPGAGKNCIQNTGTATVKNSKFSDAPNHGIYNTGKMTTEGTLTFNNIDANAIYNYTNGKVNAAELVVNTTGGHGINNAAEFTVDTLTVNAVADNGIQNSGNFTVAGKANITNAGKHGVYNGKNFVGNNITIKNAFDLSAQNNGEMEIHGLDISGTAHKAFYNSGYAELYKATVDGTSIANSSAEYLIDNNGGVLDLTDTTLKNAKGTALHNRGNANTSVTNVVINTAGNYGTFVEKGSVLSGDGLEINNITKGIDKAEGMPIKNAGKITMLDHVTLGADDPEVTGSAAEVNTTLGNIVNNAVVNDATTASYSGYDLVIKNATAGCAIYNKGVAYVTDFEADKAKDGIVSRYSGWSTLAGNVTITNSSRNPLVTYGDEGKGYKNGITIASGTNVMVDGAVGHGVNNKGSFLAAADTDITFKNITGTNVNAVNNQKTGTMTLGNVTVDGVYVEVTTKNTNSATALMLGGKTTLDGHAEISNVYYKNQTDNTNGSGVVVKNDGTLTGKGSITVNGAATNGEWQGTHNGIFIDKRSVNLEGDIIVNNVKNQGVYIANDNASLQAANVTINNVGGNAFWINNASGCAKVAGTIKVVSPVKGRGINNAGTIEAGNIDISGVTGYAAIENSSKITVTGNVLVDNILNGPGIRNKGTMTVNGTTTIQNISGTNTNGIQQDGGKTLNLKDVVITNVSSTSTGSNYGNGIYSKGTINLSGTAIISNIKLPGAALDTEGCGIVNAEAGKTIQGAGSIVIDDVERNGITNLGTINVASISVSNAGYRGIVNQGMIGSDDKTGTLTVNTTANRGIESNAGTFKLANVSVSNTNDVGIYLAGNSVMDVKKLVLDTVKNQQGFQLQHANTLIADEVEIKNIAKNGLRLYNKNGNPTVTIGKLTTMNCGEWGLAAAGALTDANINIAEMWYLNCGSGVVHGNIKSGVATPQEITQ